MAWVTFPNLLSVARIAAIPFLIFFFNNGNDAAFFWLFAAASISDFLDGYLARHFGMGSSLGQLLDPLADKILLIALLYLFGHHGLLPWWFIILSIGRDVLIMAGVSYMSIRKVAYPQGALMSSKINTLVQMVLILWLMASKLLGFSFPVITTFLMYVGLMTLVWSAYGYFAIGRKVLRGRK